MPDREKVIEGLREMSCRCTWKDIDRIRDKFQPVVNDAIALLKEQEPMEPKWENIYGDKVAFCGNCGAYLGKSKYCSRCGKAVKWDG